MLKKLFFLSFILGAVTSSYGQSYCNDFQGLLSPTITPQTVSNTGGYYEFDATSGCTFTFSHCMNGGSADGDSYLIVTDLTNMSLASNDDACGVASHLSWTAPADGTYRIHLGDCCGSTVVTCSGSDARTLAYWSDCSSCPGAAPTSVDPVTPSCGPNSFTLSATSTDALSWFDSPNTMNPPIATGSTYTTPLNATTVTYYVASYDAVNGCFADAIAVAAVVEETANINLQSESQVCESLGQISVNFTPMGGTITGTGITGNIFDAGSLGAGTYWIYYDLNDACGSNDSAQITVGAPSTDPVIYACEGEILTLTGSASGIVAWYDSQLSQSMLDTGSYDWTLTNDTTLFYGELPTDFYINNVTVSNVMISDHDFITGDDRGGIAITPNYFYVVGDGATGRIDADMTGSWTAFPKRDGIFSDLATGQLYTLWDGTDGPQGTYIGGDYVINSFCQMDEDLNINTSSMINLSQSITIDNNSGDYGMFAGKGRLVIWSSTDENFYNIDLYSGYVTILGNASINAFNSENWAFWGVTETYNGFYTVTYRDDFSDDILRYEFSSGNTTTLITFPSDISDLSSFTVSPWNNRFYFHHEYDSGTFGGLDETAGFTDASLVVGSGSLCRTAVELVVSTPMPNLGADVTICPGTSATLDPGSFDGYDWSTMESTSTIMVSTAGEYIVAVTDSIGCVNNDTINVDLYTVTPVDLGADITTCSGDVVNLNAGSGYVSYLWSSGQITSGITIDTDTLTIGSTNFGVTATDANGCMITDDANIIVIDCAGIDEQNLEAVIAYPNPVRDNLVIDLRGNTTQVIRLVDISGKVQMSVIPTSNILTLDMSELSNGIYLLQVIGENSSIQQTIKVSVSH